MSRRATVVVIVCVAVVAFAAIAGVAMFALVDAQTPVDALFASPTPAPGLSGISCVSGLIMPRSVW